MPEACSILGLSESTIRNRYKESGRWYDPSFPKPKRLGSMGRRSAIGWNAQDLYNWRDSRPEAV
ncbi:hypothetical protein ASD55_11720 [Rhodanobacter sp. Root561]|nr:hypothetical protein ASD55_11720 [Rhodanobacter sp. Root561]